MEHDLEYPKTMPPSLTTFNLMKLLWMTVSRQTLKGALVTIKFPIVQPTRRSRLILPGNVLSLEAAQNERDTARSAQADLQLWEDDRIMLSMYLTYICLLTKYVDNSTNQILNPVRKRFASINITCDTLIIFWRAL